ncbi:hypothetical protein JOD55_000209 [Arcanobacterium pluranimalium]|nr:hypothetical protein [Arcanobacterium pluranimalium]
MDDIKAALFQSFSIIFLWALPFFFGGIHTQTKIIITVLAVATLIWIIGCYIYLQRKKQNK